jgi:hypothetical protein
LPEELQHAVEHQDELDVAQEGDVSMTDVDRVEVGGPGRA